MAFDHPMHPKSDGTTIKEGFDEIAKLLSEVRDNIAAIGAAQSKAAAEDREVRRRGTGKAARNLVRNPVLVEVEGGHLSDERVEQWRAASSKVVAILGDTPDTRILALIEERKTLTRERGEAVARAEKAEARYDRLGYDLETLVATKVRLHDVPAPGHTVTTTFVPLDDIRAVLDRAKAADDA